MLLDPPLVIERHEPLPGQQLLPEPELPQESPMPAVAARKTRTAKPPQEKPQAEESVVAPAIAEREGVIHPVPLARLRDSPYQTRQAPDGAWLAELGESLRRDGLLNPCLVRRLPTAGLYELIAGHTRTAAARSIGWSEIDCRVIQCDDATARRLVLLDNAKRRDLTIIEYAEALKGLVDEYAAAGRSQRQLAADIGLSQSEISNHVRMLGLPADWQQKLAQGELSKSNARELLPWCDLPGFLTELENVLDEGQFAKFDEAVRSAAAAISRPLEGSFYQPGSGYTRVLFKATLEDRAALDLRTVGREIRAFNVPLWESLQAAALEQEQARNLKRAEKGEAQASGQKTTAEAAASRKKLAEQHNKRLYRWKIAWLQERIVRCLDAGECLATMPVLLMWFSLAGNDGHAERHLDLEQLCGRKRRESWRPVDSLELIQHLAGLTGPQATKIITEAVRRWLSHSAEKSTDVPPRMLEWLAGHLSIDIVGQWSLNRAYLELLTTAQLLELAAEWKLKPTATKRGDLVDWLFEHGRDKPCPKAVKAIKPTSLF